MGSCIGKKHNELAYIDSDSHKNSPLQPCSLKGSKEDLEAYNARTRIATAQQNPTDDMKGTQRVKRNNDEKEAQEEKKRTVSFKGKQMLMGGQSDQSDARLQQLLRKDRLMAALYLKVRQRIRQ